MRKPLPENPLSVRFSGEFAEFESSHSDTSKESSKDGSFDVSESLCFGARGLPGVAFESSHSDTSKNIRHPMTEDEKYLIYDWKYIDEYALYNNPPYEVDLEKKRGFAHPDFMGYTFYDGDRLIGFTSLYPEENAVMVGIGVAPGHCDKGYGKLMLRITCRLSKKQFPGKQLYLEVRTWNRRAIQCYNRAGFSIDGEPFTQTTGIGEGEFYRMVKK